MPMDGAVLGAALKAALTLTPNAGEAMDAFRTRVFEAMGTTIVEHIITNALVTVVVDGVTLVSAGTDPSGPGTGTGTVT